MITITPYEPAMQAQWDELVRNSRNGTFLHERAYMDYHSDRFADCSLVAHDGSGRLIGALPANRAGNDLISHQGLTYGSWLLPARHGEATAVMQLLDATVAWARAHGIGRIVYKPVPHIYHSYPCEEDLYGLFRHGARLAASNLSTVVDLASPLPPDRGNRSSANKARRAGVEIAASDDFAAYWPVLEQVLAERHEARPVHTLAEIALLRSRFPGNIRLVTARLGGEVVAGVVLFETPLVTHCQYIASSAAGREHKALSLLFATAMEQARQQGKRWFDFGTSNERQGRVLNSGLVEQKCRLGGRGIVYNTWEITV